MLCSGCNRQCGGSLYGPRDVNNPVCPICHDRLWAEQRIKELEAQLDEAKTISVQMASAFGVSCELLKALVEGVEAVGGKIDAKDMAQVNTILQLAEYLLWDGKEAAALRGEVGK